MSNPSVLSINIDRDVISDEIGFQEALLTFEFSEPVIEYKIQILGVSEDTGMNAHREVKNVGTVATQTVDELKLKTVAEIRQYENELSGVVDYTELYQEGANTVNIYGKALDGSWTIQG
jgi:hypothetical protein